MSNFRKGWRGYFWQGRFSSFIMDEAYCLTAVRYIELNPVKAKLVISPENYKWSSCKAHLNGKDDKLVVVKPLLNRISHWMDFFDKLFQKLKSPICKSMSAQDVPLEVNNLLTCLNWKQADL